MRHAIVSSALFLAVVGAGVSWPGSTAANAHNAGPSVGPGDPALKRVPDGRAASAVLRGVNLSGGEFGTVHQRSNTNTYADGRDSQPPSLADLSYLARRGVRYVRVAFRQERLQPVLKGPLSPTGVSEVRRVLDDARRAGVLVTLDWHNYARFFAGAHELTLNTSAYPIEAFVDFNAKVGQAFKDEPSLFALSLTNEPHDLPPAPGAGQGPQGSLQPSTWEDASRRAVSAGRAAGYRGWYSVAADNWSSATLLPASHPHGWWINDPLEKSMLEVHYYPDWDNVGVFSHTYAEENKHALALGFTGQQDRVRRELSRLRIGVGGTTCGAFWERPDGCRPDIASTAYQLAHARRRRGTEELRAPFSASPTPPILMWLSLPLGRTHPTMSPSPTTSTTRPSPLCHTPSRSTCRSADRDRTSSPCAVSQLGVTTSLSKTGRRDGAYDSEGSTCFR